ncbi:MAG: hypothetical protein FJ087_20485, partial [Deltaproteobacteria bacterium]|nr:hypothetical protein [Deltaproteobacteria bacterium]
MVIDLHVVAPADGGAIEALLGACARAGLDGVCLLGSNDVPPVAEARVAPGADRLALFFGVEIATDRGRLVWIPREL